MSRVAAKADEKLSLSCGQQLTSEKCSYTADDKPIELSDKDGEVPKGGTMGSRAAPVHTGTHGIPNVTRQQGPV